MNPYYQQWINDKLRYTDPDCMCAEWTIEMQQAFPELERVQGYVLLSNEDLLWHFWLVDQQGTIIDPTVSQFTKRRSEFQAFVVQYEVWPEGKPEPTGICASCAGYCTNGELCCCERCKDEYAIYIEGSYEQTSDYRYRSR